MLCPVCNTELRNQVTSCSSCPVNSGCDMLCCENCGYETVAPRSVTIELAKRVWRFATRRKPVEPMHG